MSDKTDTQYLRDMCDLLNSMHGMLFERLTRLVAQVDNIDKKVNRFSEFVLEVSPSDAKEAIAELEDELQE